MRKILVVALVLAGCGGGDGDGSTTDPLCWDYHPHPISQPDRTDEWCEPAEGWAFDFFEWRTGEPCEQVGSENTGSVAIRDNGSFSAGDEVYGCRVRWDCYEHAIDNPECCAGVIYDRGVANCRR